LWLRIEELPGTGEWRDLVQFEDASNNDILRFGYRNDSGIYKWYLNVGGQELTWVNTLTTGQFYLIEIEYDSVSNYHYVSIDGIIRITLNASITEWVNILSMETLIMETDLLPLNTLIIYA